MVVIGFEVLLVFGVVDVVCVVGIVCFGFGKDVVCIEGFKVFVKDVMVVVGVCIVNSEIVDSLVYLDVVLDWFGLFVGDLVWVVKDDWLVVGKGVVVIVDCDVVCVYGVVLFEVGYLVLLEFYLDGLEVLLFCVVDCIVVVLLLLVQDFK